MSDIKFVREKGDGDGDPDEPCLAGYVYLNLSATENDVDQIGTLSGWVKAPVYERIKAALNVTGDVQPGRIWF